MNLDTLGIVKALKKGGTTWVEGYLFRLDPPVQVFKSDPELPPTWYIVTSQPTDWGLPCVPQYTPIDPDTICPCCGILPDGKRVFVGDQLSIDTEDQVGTIAPWGETTRINEWGITLYQLLWLNQKNPLNIKVVGNIYNKEDS